MTPQPPVGTVGATPQPPVGTVGATPQPPAGTVGATPQPPVNSVDRALRLARLLVERHRLRVHEAADALGLAPSTVHRLLTALVAHGFATRDRHHVYAVGPFLRGLAVPAPASPDLTHVAHPHLVALSRLTRETVHLVMLEGNGVRFVDGVEGGQTIRVASRTGIVLPAHLTSGGKVLLAELSAAELAGLYPRGLPLRAGAAGPDIGELRRELGNVRRRGYAVNAEETEQGVNALGACVHGPDGAALAAVVVAAPSQRVSRRALSDLAPAVLAAAARISDELS
ncbi:IclR family transcriptional regulator [Rugosimonospora africana]|uniref:IclR family transcriptional regulator n=1 Tax=Rugosimonospora africana TaxID=556532 RepID=UPI00194377BF|nr:IclR family transcriptional regulator [Rugosimonospora africana]